MSARTRIFRSTGRSLVMAAVAAATLAGPASATAGSASAASASTASASGATSCAVTWGSLTKAHASSARAPLALTRTGRHECYDRVVFEFEGAVDGYRIEYVDAVRPGTDGYTLDVAGGARMQVTLMAPVLDGVRWTYPQSFQSDHVADVTGYQTLRDVMFGGSSSIGHDWETTFGIGVRARLPFRAFLLAGPGTHSRLVVDVAHRW
jgi:hypothetical protein